MNSPQVKQLMNSPITKNKSKSKKDIDDDRIRNRLNGDQTTVDYFRQALNELGFYDAKQEAKLKKKVIEQQAIDSKKTVETPPKYLIQEYNLINFFLEVFDVMSQVKDQPYTADSFVICLIEINRNRGSKNPINQVTQESLKTLLTQFIASFEYFAEKSPEICYFSHLLYPEDLPNICPEFFSFYLKLRKFVVANFTNDREKNQKPLKFDQWVSVVSRFLDNKAITIIGQKIKEKQSLSNKNEKIIDNSVEYFELITLCCDEFQERLANKMPSVNQKRQNLSQMSEEPQEEDQNQLPQEQQVEVEQKQKPKAMKIAYTAVMGPSPDSLKKSKEKQDNAQQLIQPQPFQQQSSQSNDQQLKSANEQIQKLENKIRQLENSNMILKSSVSTHLQLAKNYNLLKNFSTNFCKEVQGLLNKQKIPNGEAANEEELETLYNMSQFNQYLEEDPEETLLNTGVLNIQNK